MSSSYLALTKLSAKPAALIDGAAVRCFGVADVTFAEDLDWDGNNFI